MKKTPTTEPAGERRLEQPFPLGYEYDRLMNKVRYILCLVQAAPEPAQELRQVRQALQAEIDRLVGAYGDPYPLKLLHQAASQHT